MSSLLFQEAEALARGMAESYVRMAAALESGDLGEAMHAIDQQARLQAELQPRLSALHAQPADTQYEHARHRIAELLQSALSSSRNSGAELVASRKLLQERILAARRQAPAAAAYGTVDMPVSSGFVRQS
jgi:hypothetical protein